MKKYIEIDTSTEEGKLLMGAVAYFWGESTLPSMHPDEILQKFENKTKNMVFANHEPIIPSGKKINSFSEKTETEKEILFNELLETVRKAQHVLDAYFSGIPRLPKIKKETVIISLTSFLHKDELKNLMANYGANSGLMNWAQSENEKKKKPEVKYKTGDRFFLKGYDIVFQIVTVTNGNAPQQWAFLSNMENGRGYTGKLTAITDTSAITEAEFLNMRGGKEEGYNTFISCKTGTMEQGTKCKPFNPQAHENMR